MDVINYAFDTDGVGELDHNFNPTIKSVLSVLVQNQNDQVLMNIEVEDIFDGDDLNKFNNFFLNWSVAFGFEVNVPIWKPRYCGHSLPKRDGSRIKLINAGPLTFTMPKLLVTPSEIHLSNILNMSLEVTDQNLIYLHQYAFAIAESNQISRYSFLYNLLLHMCNDRQANVDRLILEIVPTCKKSVSPNKKKQETIYTKLRNELAHKREGTKFSDTKSEIERVINEFSGIVKKIVVARINKNS